MPEKLETDPRPKVKELAKQFEFFQSVYGKVPENVEKGYFSINSCCLYKSIKTVAFDEIIFS